MEIEIINCNNINKGLIKLEENKLNIKYAINGTGKSTIAKALMYSIDNKIGNIKDLKPFKLIESKLPEDQPEVKGAENFKNISVFNEQYIEQYVYKPDELVQNSFEIFIRNSNYDEQLKEIEKLIVEIKEIFDNNPELNETVNSMRTFIGAFGSAKNGFSMAGMLGKAFGKGNKLENIPMELAPYSEHLKHQSNFKWLRWQMDGKSYLEISDCCPYCATKVESSRDRILKISEVYDPKSIEHLNKIIEVFDSLSQYFTDETNNRIEDISKNIKGISIEEQRYLISIKDEVTLFLEKLDNIKKIGFFTLKDIDKLSDVLLSYKIELKFITHLNAEYTQNKIDKINISLDNIIHKSGKLKGEISKHKRNIENTIKSHELEINNFLRNAGYDYSISIIQDEADSYKMKLTHKDVGFSISEVKNHLSYGERNAFALVLFMYSSLKSNADLIILDDPVSSFDGNKKFAILNMLFMGNTCLKNKTVLMFTHEFNSVIDAIYNMSSKLSVIPKASFLINNSGCLVEKEILKNDIKSFSEIALENIQNSKENLNKCVYLRRFLEIEKPNCLGWQLLSNLFHKREEPIIKLSFVDSRKMSNDEICEAQQEIREYIRDFDYSSEFKKTQNNFVMATLYNNSCSNYEKIQIYRIIFNKSKLNDIVKKYVNEIFHVENDFLFQLDPCKYDTVSNYIIDICDENVNNLIDID